MSGLQKAVWVTGVSSGIGRALATEFTRQGEIVLATSRQKNLIESYKKELPFDSTNLLPGSVNISDINQIRDFFQSVSKNYFVHCLINNAGITSFKDAEENSIEEIREIIVTNLLGSIYAIKTVLPQMISNNSGTIINILSVVTKKIFTGSSAYSSSKAGLLAYSDSLREEVRKYNIRVINVSPGATTTSIWSKNVLDKHSSRMMKPADLAKLIYNMYAVEGNLVTEELVVRPIQGDI